jgi:hypothetical protein
MYKGEPVTLGFRTILAAETVIPEIERVPTLLP